MRSLTALLVCCSLAIPATPAMAAEIVVTDPADIALVVAINAATDATADQMGTCIYDGGDRQDCLCASADLIAGVSTALDAALAVHPEWAGQALHVADTGDSTFQSLTMFLGTVATSAVAPVCG